MTTANPAVHRIADLSRRHVARCTCGRWFRSATPAGAAMMLEHHIANAPQGSRLQHGACPR